MLSEADRPFVDRLAAGLGDEPARVLAFLVLRSEQYPDADPPTETVVQIGTGLNRSRVGDALDTLDERNLVVETTVRTETPGRPPTAWHASESGDRQEVVRRVHDGHAERLLAQGRRLCGDADDSENGREGDEREVDDLGVDDGDSDDSTVDVTIGLNWQPNGLQLPIYAAMTAGSYTTRETFGDAFERVGQLEGRRVGMPAASETSLLGRLFLTQAGVLEDVECVDLAGEELAALESESVDAVTGMFFDPLRLEEAGATVDVVHVADRFPVYGPALVTREDAVPNRRRLLRAIVGGTVEGWTVATQSPADAIECVAARTDAAAAWIERVFDRAVARFGSTEAVRKHGWGWHDRETWTRLETALAQVDLLESEP
ncbi:ABC transporter substrate-binding protein [Natrialbaceae archaeon AArc-T1-2]|uniref:ABC transporter substrate-binding protein n=1 Tax=Natrialbaceae archaeon AArc-T1-2 TaxID=3053904 RepID=UPI00255AB53F|nr:ABC transporter substrate-binding protein [Natrialbaceae archaeon AArc-T1-2]WIV66386.1 ABC transporter substrate-binding protein [Natrialbaceae archaeon AArc-T1-2]